MGATRDVAAWASELTYDDIPERLHAKTKAQFLIAEQCLEGQGHLFCPATPLPELLDRILPTARKKVGAG